MFNLGMDETSTVREPQFAGLMTSADIFHYWPEIEKSLDRVPLLWDTWTKEGLRNAALENRLQFWGLGREAIELFAITSIETHETGRKSLNIRLLVGKNLHEYWKFLNRIGEEVALKLGCDQITFSTSEDAMEMVAERIGFRTQFVTLVRDVRSGSVQ